MKTKAVLGIVVLLVIIIAVVAFVSMPKQESGTGTTGVTPPSLSDSSFDVSLNSVESDIDNIVLEAEPATTQEVPAP